MKQCELNKPKILIFWHSLILYIDIIANMANPNDFIHSSSKASKPSYGMDLLWPHHRLTQRLNFLNASEPASSRAQNPSSISISSFFFFGLCVLLVLLCKIKDNLTRNLGEKKPLKRLRLIFLYLLNKKWGLYLCFFVFVIN